MPTKPPAPLTVEAHERFHKFSGAHHYSELARISTGLFVGVLALMTFLLTAGLQHPQPLFSFFVYASLVTLPLSLVAFTIGHNIQQMSGGPKADPKDKAAVGQPKTWTALKITRLVQQLLFIISVAAVTGLALVSAHIFFAPPAAAPPASAQPQPVQTQ